jgi:hypothetical protein
MCCSLVGQPGRGEPVAHGRRDALVVGHGVMVHPAPTSPGKSVRLVTVTVSEE